MSESVQRYRKLPVVIDAIQWTGHNVEAVFALLERSSTGGYLTPDGYLRIRTLESGGGAHEADFGDWIILGVQNEAYPCKPDIFAATYEPAPVVSPLEARAADPGIERRESAGGETA